MIDFRYHLVSLVSVFMALAIGVVLGAGPLRDSIGDQLSSQVDALVQDKSDLQQAVSNREAEIGDRDTFVDAVGGSLTASQLGGRSVLVVTLPGADSSTVDALSEGLSAAGATVSGQVAVNPVWTDPDQADVRAAAATDLAEVVEQAAAGGDDAAGAAPDPTSTPDDDPGTVLAELLAGAVLTPEVAEQGQASDSGPAVLDGLGGADLVSTDGEPATRATVAVVVTGPPSDAAGADDEDWTAAAGPAYLQLLTALDDGSAGVVLAGPESATGDDGLLGQLRAEDDLSTEVTGVDSADTPMGRITTVLAIREEMAGRSGQYGYADNAAAPVPADLGAVDPPAGPGAEESAPGTAGTDG